MPNDTLYGQTTLPGDTDKPIPPNYFAPNCIALRSSVLPKRYRQTTLSSDTAKTIPSSAIADRFCPAIYQTILPHDIVRAKRRTRSVLPLPQPHLLRSAVTGTTVGKIRADPMPQGPCDGRNRLHACYGKGPHRAFLRFLSSEALYLTQQPKKKNESATRWMDDRTTAWYQTNVNAKQNWHANDFGWCLAWEVMSLSFSFCPKRATLNVAHVIKGSECSNDCWR